MDRRSLQVFLATITRCASKLTLPACTLPRPQQYYEGSRCVLCVPRIQAQAGGPDRRTAVGADGVQYEAPLCKTGEAGMRMALLVGACQLACATRCTSGTSDTLGAVRALGLRLQGSEFMEYCKEVSNDNNKNKKRRTINGTL